MVNIQCCVCCVSGKSGRKVRRKKKTPKEEIRVEYRCSYAFPLAPACPHCNSHFMWSDLLEETSDLLTLQCSRCWNAYPLSNSTEQRKFLSNGYGQLCQIEPLKDVKQLRRGEVIAFKQKFMLIPYEHNGVVTDVNYATGDVQLSEFRMALPIRKGSVVRRTMNFDRHIKPQNSWVRRYMPLDCLSLGEVMEKANAFVEKPSTQPKYDLFRYNCQHLSSYCKTGRMVSEEASQARWIYHFLIHGLQIVSIFAVPPLLPGVLIVSAADVVIRTAGIRRTEEDLINKGIKSPEEAEADIRSDQVSIAATALFALTAVPMVGAGAAAACIARGATAGACAFKMATE